MGVVRGLFVCQCELLKRSPKAVTARVQCKWFAFPWRGACYSMRREMSALASVELNDTLAQAQAQQSPVAVLMSRFPSVTETFILREMIEMERQGMPVR